MRDKSYKMKDRQYLLQVVHGVGKTYYTNISCK